jgi:hypothetical protein
MNIYTIHLYPDSLAGAFSAGPVRPITVIARSKAAALKSVRHQEVRAIEKVRTLEDEVARLQSTAIRYQSNLFVPRSLVRESWTLHSRIKSLLAS